MFTLYVRSPRNARNTQACTKRTFGSYESAITTFMRACPAWRGMCTATRHPNSATVTFTTDDLYQQVSKKLDASAK